MRMAIVGRNPRAGGAECILFGHICKRSHLFAPISGAVKDGRSEDGELRWGGDWDVRDMRPGLSLMRAPALVGVGPDEVYGFTTGRLVLVSHSWSGVLKINDVGRKYTIDLFSENTRLVLLDLVNEIIVDVTSLAATENGVLKLPSLSIDRIVEHIRATTAWFRFLEPDANFDPGPVRRAIEYLRPRRDERWKLRLLSSLVPSLLTSRAPPPVVPVPSVAPVAPPPRPTEDVARLRDEMRLLAAAVEGLARRAPIEA